MLKAVLQRTSDDGKQTLGKLTIGDKVFYTVERPWLNNKPRISCIPSGKYICTPHNWEESPKLRFKSVWRVKNVPDRSAILIHVGNIVDDVIGCIAVGLAQGFVKDKPAVISSIAAMGRLRDMIGRNDFELEIRNP